jgi:hypothetical protein
MAYRFESVWSDEVRSVSERTEYQTCDIRIIDPSLLTEDDYDIESGQWALAGDSTLYEGQARVIGIARGIFSGGEAQANATTITPVRIQIPWSEESERVKRGCKVRVTNAPRNPVLESYVFTVTSDFHGSSAGARTFEAALDLDSVVA